MHPWPFAHTPVPPVLLKLRLAVLTAAQTPKSAVMSATAWALVRAPSVPWSGLKGIGAVQTNGVPAPLTLSGPAACARAATTRVMAAAASARNRGGTMCFILGLSGG